MAHPKHEQVRRRYAFCCGYCGVSEESAGSELTIDHYQPVSAGGDNSDDNLVYACWRCNLYKSDIFPSAADIAIGHRLLHPLLDDVSAHILANEITGYLEPRTETGRFHILTLHLNRPALIIHRQRHWLRSLSDDVLRMNVEEVRRLRILLADTEARLLLIDPDANSAANPNRLDADE